MNWGWHWLKLYLTWFYEMTDKTNSLKSLHWLLIAYCWLVGQGCHRHHCHQILWNRPIQKSKLKPWQHSKETESKFDLLNLKGEKNKLKYHSGHQYGKAGIHNSPLYSGALLISGTFTFNFVKVLLFFKLSSFFKFSQFPQLSFSLGSKLSLSLLSKLVTVSKLSLSQFSKLSPFPNLSLFFKLSLLLTFHFHCLSKFSLSLWLIFHFHCLAKFSLSIWLAFHFHCLSKDSFLSNHYQMAASKALL